MCIYVVVRCVYYMYKRVRVVYYAAQRYEGKKKEKKKGKKRETLRMNSRVKALCTRTGVPTTVVQYRYIMYYVIRYICVYGTEPILYGSLFFFPFLESCVSCRPRGHVPVCAYIIYTCTYSWIGNKSAGVNMCVLRERLDGKK